jgi:hypothetical protein
MTLERVRLDLMRALLVALTLSVCLFAGCLGPTADDPPAAGEPGETGTGEAASMNATVGPIQESAAEFLVGVSGCGVLFLGELAGTDHAEIPVRPEAHEQPFVASFTAAAPAAQVGVSFFAGESFLETFSAMEYEVRGMVPASSDTAILWACGGAEIAVHFLVE